MEPYRDGDVVDGPPTKLKLRRKMDDPDQPGRKRVRKEKDAEVVEAPPASGVAFLTTSGREDIESGKSLLELLLKPSRTKGGKRRDADEVTFATHDTIMVPQGLVDKIDLKLKEDFVCAVATEHTKNWIRMSSFGNNREFIQSLTQVVQPRYPCSYPTILDEVLVSFIFKRPEYTDDLVQPLILRLTHSNEHVSLEKNPLLQTMLAKIALLHTGALFGDSMAATRHRIATLAILKTLFHGNKDRLFLSTWILECLRVCSDDVLAATVAKLTNSIAFLPLMQPERHSLPWLLMWQDEPWNIYDGGHQLVDLVHLETKCDGRRVTRAIVREALARFAYAPQGHFAYFAPAFRSYLSPGTTDSLAMLTDVLATFPTRYAPSDPHPIALVLDLLASSLPLTIAAENAWFVHHLWPVVLRADDPTLLSLVFHRYMPLVLGGAADKEAADTLGLAAPVVFPLIDAWQSLLIFLGHIPTHTCKRVAAVRGVFDAWRAAWRDAALPLHVVVHMVCVSLSFGTLDALPSAARATTVEFHQLTQDLLSRHAGRLAEASAFLAFMQCLLQTPTGVCPKRVAQSLAVVLAHSTAAHSLSFQRVVVASLLPADDAGNSGPAFFDWKAHVLRAMPSHEGQYAGSASPSLLTVQILAELVLDETPIVAAFVRAQLTTSPAVLDALLERLALLGATAVAIVALLRHLVDASGEALPTLWTRPHVLAAIVNAAHNQGDPARGLLHTYVQRLAKPLPLLRLCVDALPEAPVHEVLSYVHFVKVSLAASPHAWRAVLGVASQYLTARETPAWRERSPQHVGLLVLRMLIQLQWRTEYVAVILVALRTLETATDAICVLQLSILYEVVAKAPDTADDIDTGGNLQARLQDVADRRGPSVAALAKKTLRLLDRR
ncbi:hypothetical protein ACHHYP_13308 [Achlya hypogyna]|uniref:Uncharacterized protein n=1 Tax=Achlya hypogyna TaxID=1202772 RepID=A0A1V9YFG5_ACHHY|nr:hypothetical protein ACHHYP_13308 [Achlya hypogyna]